MLSAWSTVAGAQPDHTALQAGTSRRYTYGEIEAATEMLRGYLVDKGLQSLDRVGIALGPSVAELVALVAVLKAGAVYVPIDPSLPPSDRRHVIQDAGVRVLLLPARAEPVAAEEVDLSGALYILYTSGSTGAPKGVVGSQAASLHRLQWMWTTHPFQGQETVLRRTMLTFVDSVWEIWGTLLAGMTLFLPPEGLSANPVAFWSSALHSNIHRLSLTPSLLSLLLRMGVSFPSSLRYCLCSGEPLPLSLAVAFFNTTSTSTPSTSASTSSSPWPMLLNLYGSTETSGDATCLALTRDSISTLSSQEPFVPLGSPLPGSEVEVTEEGILVVKGTVVAQGYYRSGGQFGGEFETGDVVERMADGSLQFRGRRDGVIKIRGVRVGLEEAEARMRRALGLETDQAAVVVIEDGQAGGKSLALVLKKQMMHAGTALESVASVLSRLREELPTVMVPSHVTLIDEPMPMTSSGKVDRMALSRMMKGTGERKRPRDSNEEEIENLKGKAGVKDVEHWLERAFEEAVGEAQERVEEAKGQPFLLRGGDSLTAAQVLWRIKQTFGVEVTLEQLNWTVGRLAALIAENVAEASGEAEMEEKEEGEREGEGGARLEECWRVGLGKCIDATPAVILGGHVAVIGSHAGVVVGVEVGDGQERWRAQVGGRVEASAAVGDGDRVFVGCHDGRLYAFEGATGELAWSFQTGAEIKCRPLPLCLPFVSQGSPQPVLIFGSYDGFLYILRQSDGALLLRSSMGGSLFASPISVPHPSAPSPSLCLCTNRGHLSLHQPNSSPTSPLALSELWRVDLGCPAFSTPCLVSSSLLILGCIDASIRAFDAHTGHVAWRCTTQGPVFSSPTPSPCSTLVYIGCHDGRVRAIRALDGKVEWSVVPPQGPVQKGNKDAIFASPYVHMTENQRVVVIVASCSGRLCVLDGLDGRVLCYWEGEGELFSSPVCVGDMLLMGSRDDYLYGLSLAMHAEGKRGKSEK